MKKTKFFVIILVIFFIFLFAPGFYPKNEQFEQDLNLISGQEVIIIFNSGGWGNTPLKEAEDFKPIIEGIQQTLSGWGYTAIVIPYQRTQNNFFGKLKGARSFANVFENQAKDLADNLKEFLGESNSRDQKIILTGLSLGAVFVDKVMEELPQIEQILAIEVGLPFWEKSISSENILCLDNEAQDPLAKGEMKTLFFTFLKAPFKWFWAQVNSQELSFTQACHVQGHDYPWHTPKVGDKIMYFLENEFTSAP